MFPSSKKFLEITNNIHPDIAIILGSGLTNFFEEEDIIASGLEDTMRNSFKEILEMKTKFKLEDYRLAAYAIAIKKIEKSYLELGI